MKKTLIASAVAAAALSTNAFADDHGGVEGPTLFGAIELMYVTTDDGDDTESTFADNGSTIGVEGSHMINDDIKAFYNATFEFGAEGSTGDDGQSGFSALDEAYIGIEGGFGKAMVGSFDPVYDDVEHVDMSENTGIDTNLAGFGNVDLITYVSPTIADSLTIGVSAPLDGDDFGDAHDFAIAANYEMDAISATLAYAAGDTAEDSIGLAGTFAASEELSIAAQFEQMDETDLIALGATYTMGANSFNLAYSTKDEDGDTTDTIFLQALHNVTDSLYVYAEGAFKSADTAANEVDTITIGTAYSF